MTKKKNKGKDGNGYVWNSIAGLVNAGEAVILSMIVTRTNGLADAGILSIAFAVGNLMMTIGKFGVRNYQVTDLEGKFSFSDYFWARMVTAGWMVVFSLSYIIYCIQEKGYSRYKAAVILAVCFIYTVESVEDVFWGLYQQKQALDAGAKMFIFRWAAVLAAIILSLVLYQDLSLAAVLGAGVCLVVFCIYNVAVFRTYDEKIARIRLLSVYQVLRQCMPLFLVAFLSFYVINAPKYAIDRYLTEEAQACYGFVAMPVFMVGLLNGFIYQPALVQMALEWNEGRLAEFKKRMRRQCVIIAGLTAVCLAGAFLCGIPVLSVIYGTDLSGYRAELLILLFGGGINALAGYLCVLLTIMRKQDWIMYGYAGAAVLALFFSNVTVRYFAVTGATVFYVLLMLGLAGCFLVMYRRGLQEHME